MMYITLKFVKTIGIQMVIESTGIENIQRVWAINIVNEKICVYILSEFIGVTRFLLPYL